MEIWRDIKDYEGLYQISNLGNVRSVERIVKYFNPKLNRESSHKVMGKIKKPGIKDNGYLQIGLYKNNKIRKRYENNLYLYFFMI